MNVLPEFIVDKAVMSMHAGIRKRGLKKDAKLATEGKKEWIADGHGDYGNLMMALDDVLECSESSPLLVVW